MAMLGCMVEKSLVSVTSCAAPVMNRSLPLPLEYRDSDIAPASPDTYSDVMPASSKCSSSTPPESLTGPLVETLSSA